MCRASKSLPLCWDALKTLASHHVACLLNAPGNFNYSAERHQSIRLARKKGSRRKHKLNEGPAFACRSLRVERPRREEIGKR